MVSVCGSKSDEAKYGDLKAVSVCGGKVRHSESGVISLSLSGVVTSTICQSDEAKYGDLKAVSVCGALVTLRANNHFGRVPSLFALSAELLCVNKLFDRLAHGGHPIIPPRHHSTEVLSFI
ncbi:hypothetical protein RRG08_056081 [Elysia crispata]|uniref:Uncharacterized protein n=1 Tax=Elysia crispata TaxID=231223 RepID=A0AAE0ZDJ4_9GAST|nr:hypothetical protein RRG08_056081 [Elysia crispata]